VAGTFIALQARGGPPLTTQSLRKSVLDIGSRIGRPVLVLPGAKFLVMALCALPVAVVGLSASTTAEALSGPLAAMWLSLLPVALYKRWATIGLLFVPAALLFISLFALPLNSTAFVVDFWTSTLMLVLALPRRQAT
jgi:hypothetical protein